MKICKYLFNSPLFPTDLLSEESEESMEDLLPRLKLRNISLSRFLRLRLDLFFADGADAVVTLLNTGEYEKEKLRCSTTCRRGCWARSFYDLVLKVRNGFWKVGVLICFFTSKTEEPSISSLYPIFVVEVVISERGER